jgi:hypothetical protein
MRRLAAAGDSRITPVEIFGALRFCGINGPLFPNLGSLELWDTVGEFIPFVPSLLSPRIIDIDIEFSEYADLPNVAIASMVTTFPTLCPNLQNIRLRFLPRDPIIVAAVSGFLLAANRDALRHFHVESPLTEEAREVICKLPGLRGLTVVVEGSTSLPIMALPNLTEIDVEYDDNCDWLDGFRGATLERLNSVAFHTKSEFAQVSDFFGAFKSIGLPTSTMLSSFSFYTPHPWRPNYHSLLSFKQLRELEIGFSCDDGCSSTIDDDIITDIAQAMPMLESLRLGEEPCQTPTGATAKGLAVLAHRCPNLSFLNIHFRADSFNPLPTIAGTHYTRSTVPRKDCVLGFLEVGQIPILEESVLMVALTLTRLFPNIVDISYTEENWAEVSKAMQLSKLFVDRSSKEYFLGSLVTLRSNLNHTSPGATLESDS